MSITRDEVRRRVEAASPKSMPCYVSGLRLNVEPHWSIDGLFVWRCENGADASSGVTESHEGGITATIDAAVDHFVEVLEFFGVEVHGERLDTQGPRQAPARHRRGAVRPVVRAGACQGDGHDRDERRPAHQLKSRPQARQSRSEPPERKVRGRVGADAKRPQNGSTGPLGQ